MNHDEPAAARQERLEVGALLPVGDVAGFLRVQDQHVGVVELRLRREGVGAGGPGAAAVQERHPLLEEARMIVRPWTVRLRAAANEDAQWRLLHDRDILAERQHAHGCNKEQKSESHGGILLNAKTVSHR